MQCLFDRFHTFVEHLEIGARELRPEAARASGQAGDGRKVGDVLRQRVHRKCAETHVIAADRHQNDIDRPLA